MTGSKKRLVATEIGLLCDPQIGVKFAQSVAALSEVAKTISTTDYSEILKNEWAIFEIEPFKTYNKKRGDFLAEMKKDLNLEELIIEKEDPPMT